MRLAIALIAALSLSQLAGCATKSYGRQSALTGFERQNLTCREIDIEIAKTEGFMQTVYEGDKFDAKTVLGLLGDFGIGNAMEHSAAVDSGRKRINDLQELRGKRACGTPGQTTPIAATTTPTPDPLAPSGNMWSQ